MTYKTHLNGGILAGLYLISTRVTNEPAVSTAIFIGGVAVGSIFPDIDHKNSYIGKKTKNVSKAISKLAGHRKLFHAPLIYLLLYSLSLGMNFEKLILIGIKGLFLGIFSHLILDSFTIGGLPWFYPLSKKKYSIGNVKTNGLGEILLCLVLTFINVVIILNIFNIITISKYI